MKNLPTDLLKDQTPLFPEDGQFRAVLNAHGLYHTFQFVLRLSPEVHRKIASLPNGITSEPVDFDGLKAFSTYLHETVHWWQHIGSTYGLMLSMTYPVQSHSNYEHLKSLVANVGFKKSILRLAATLPKGGFGTPAGTANIVVNNHFDMETFRNLTVSPLAAQIVLQDPQFESVGHAFEVLYGNSISLLSSVSDRQFSVIPHPKEWEVEFHKLRDAKVEGYYYGSPIRLPQLGAFDIFEGQARVAQLQYLHFATGGRFEMADAVEGGMFKNVYGTAFKGFLTMTGLDWPSSLDHPTVGLFLLMCDLAINPGSGFPFPLVNFESFVQDVDPGQRFMMMSKFAPSACPGVLTSIRDYSRDEYAEVSQKLCGTIVEMPPLAIANEFRRWSESPEFQPLMGQYASFVFEKGNVVPRVLFSHFLAFMRDKFARPEFFCWPGAHMAGKLLTSDSPILFERHNAPFVDKEDDDGVFPRLVAGRSERNLQETFEDFYGHNVVFNLTRQWITRPGSFEYDFGWLSPKGGSDEAIRGYCDRVFKSIYGVEPSSVELI